MWFSQSALERIRELETQLAEERAAHAKERAEIAARHSARVREVEEQLTEERRENRRTERHYGNMILRRGESFPVPPVKEPPTDEAKSIHRPLSPTVLAKYESIRLEAGIHGKQMSDPDVAQWVKDETGYTPSEIEQRLQAQLSSELEQ